MLVAAEIIGARCNCVDWTKGKCLNENARRWLDRRKTERDEGTEDNVASGQESSPHGDRLSIMGVECNTCLLMVGSGSCFVPSNDST